MLSPSAPPDSGRRLSLQSHTTQALTTTNESRGPVWPRGCLPTWGRLTGACPDGGGSFPTYAEVLFYAAVRAAVELDLPLSGQAEHVGA